MPAVRHAGGAAAAGRSPGAAARSRTGLAGTCHRLAATSLALALVVTAGLPGARGGQRLPGDPDERCRARRCFAVLAALPLAVPSYVAAFTWVSVAALWSSAARFEGFGAAVVVLTLVHLPVRLPARGRRAARARTRPRRRWPARWAGGRGARFTTRDPPPGPPGHRRRRAARRSSTSSRTSAPSRSCAWTPSPGRSSRPSSAGFDRAGRPEPVHDPAWLTVLVLTLEGRTRRRDARYESGPARAGPRAPLDLGRRPVGGRWRC